MVKQCFSVTCKLMISCESFSARGCEKFGLKNLVNVAGFSILVIYEAFVTGDTSVSAKIRATIADHTDSGRVFGKDNLETTEEIEVANYVKTAFFLFLKKRPKGNKKICYFVVVVITLIMINYLLLSRSACRGFTVLIKGVKTLDFMGHLYLVK